MIKDDAVVEILPQVGTLFGLQMAPKTLYTCFMFCVMLCFYVLLPRPFTCYVYFLSLSVFLPFLVITCSSAANQTRCWVFGLEFLVSSFSRSSTLEFILLERANTLIQPIVKCRQSLTWCYWWHNSNGLHHQQWGVGLEHEEQLKDVVIDSSERLLIFEFNSQSNYTLHSSIRKEHFKRDCIIALVFPRQQWH